MVGRVTFRKVGRRFRDKNKGQESRGDWLCKYDERGEGESEEGGVEACSVPLVPLVPKLVPLSSFLGTSPL